MTKLCLRLAGLQSLGHFQFVPSGRSDKSVLKYYAKVLRTGSSQSRPAHGSDPLSSPAPIGQSEGICKIVAGKIYARALDLSIQTGHN